MDATTWSLEKLIWPVIALSVIVFLMMSGIIGYLVWTYYQLRAAGHTAARPPGTDIPVGE
jgi:hypothetical protein